MDSWNDKQIQKMRVGGNDKLNAFLQQYGIPKTMPIPQKYNTPAASLYRDRVDAAANGRPLPTELPTSPASGTMSGAGSTHTSTGSLSSRYEAPLHTPLSHCGYTLTFRLNASTAAWPRGQTLYPEKARPPTWPGNDCCRKRPVSGCGKSSEPPTACAPEGAAGAWPG
jgi:hypothetical protein